MTARTIRNVVLTKDDDDDWNYHIQMDDDERIPRFEIKPCQHVAYSENIARRHLDTKRKAIFGARWNEYEKLAAKERQKGGQGGVLLPVTLPEANGDSRDKAGKRVGVSGSSIEKVAVMVVRIIDELADLSWLAEVEMVEGLVPYLKAWCIFEYDVTENGFTSGDLRTTFPTERQI